MFLPSVYLILGLISNIIYTINNNKNMDHNNNNNKGNYVLSGSILVAALLIAGSVIYSNGTNNSGLASADKTVGGDAGDAFAVQKNDIVLGETKAPVTIFVYSDPSCPFCAAAAGANKEVIDYLKSNSPSWTAPIPGIIDNYVDSGKVRLVYRYYPGHGTGEEAMKVLYCANEQGKFWKLHEVLGDNQSSLQDLVKVKELAAGIGVDIDKIDSCLNAKKYDSKIQSDVAMGTKAGVSGTPAFFINKVLVSGAQPFSAFKSKIDAVLSAL